MCILLGTCDWPVDVVAPLSQLICNLLADTFFKINQPLFGWIYRNVDLDTLCNYIIHALVFQRGLTFLVIVYINS